MQVLYSRCCGLDVHKEIVVACVLIHHPSGEREVRLKEFATDRKSLYRLRLWLHASKVEHVAMESTGVYWKPVWNVLEPHFPILLANPQHMRNIPGRKTGQKDAEWIADLDAHGLLRPSLVPDAATRELRDLTRYRVKLTQELNRTVNRIEKLLEDTGIKLSVVASDLMGASAREMLKRIAGGCERPDTLADLRINRLRSSRELVRRALYGDVRDPHRLMLRYLLNDVERIERRIAEVETEIERRVQPQADLIARLDTVPGVDVLTIWTVLAELGSDTRHFPDASHAASWAGLCPGSHESAGKRKSGRTRKGNRWLRRSLCQAAWAASREKDCQLAAFFYKIAARHGMKKAVIATAHRILVILFHLMRDGGEYRELGGDYYDRLNPQRTLKRLSRRAQRLGFLLVPAVADSPAQKETTKRKRGRPCLCALRGLPCLHRSDLSPVDERPNT